MPAKAGIQPGMTRKEHGPAAARLKLLVLRCVYDSERVWLELRAEPTGFEPCQGVRSIVRKRGEPMPDIQAMTKQLNDQLKRESESLDLWNSFEPITVTDQRRKTFNVRSEMITS
jgi:hypothetical protein